MSKLNRFVASLLLWAAFFAANASTPSKNAPVSSPAPASLPYPAAKRDSIVDNYFGTRVPAPYRWMENLNSPALKHWVEEENKLTSRYLDRLPVGRWIHKRLTKMWNYQKVGVPTRKGESLFFRENSGLQNQSVVYEQTSLSAKPRLVLDPNQLSPDGAIALSDDVPSPDGHYLLYGLSQGGSDWSVLHIKNILTGRDLPDRVRWVKFSNLAWTKDEQGFFYSRYPAPHPGQTISDQLKHQTLYYHRLGTGQNADRLIYARPDLPRWLIEGSVSQDGRFLEVQLINGTAVANELFIADLGDPSHPNIQAPLHPLYTNNDAQYRPIGNLGDTIFLQTTRDAPNRKIVSFPLDDPASVHWHTVVPERTNVIRNALMAGGEVVVSYLVDARSEVDLFAPDGATKGRLHLPGIGSMAGLSGRNDTPELFYGFTSFLYPTTIYHDDLRTGRTTVFARPQVPFDPSPYQTRQVFYHSKDGTRVPLFITCRKDLKLDGTHPTVLYGYGGFDISITPRFSPMLPLWLELGGVYAVANLRGGGEYGQAWHRAGMLGNKQNVFADFIAAAEFLVREKYTSPGHLGISGYSNGGLLVGATLTQRPGLFGAAYAGAGVMDMLRYQKFSGGDLWVPEYGSSDNPRAFRWLYAYSPLQNLKKGTCYPPTIITTADHDDRVVPSHSYKFAATMQYDQGCPNPVLLRVETQTSHGYMPTDKRIAQTSDVWAFLAHNLGIQSPPTQPDNSLPK